jgi:hypothetical protein
LRCYDLPDISTIKTTEALNNFTNMLRIPMGKAPLAIKGKPNLPNRIAYRKSSTSSLKYK